MLHTNEANSDTCPAVRRTVRLQGGRTLSTYRVSVVRLPVFRYEPGPNVVRATAGVSGGGCAGHAQALAYSAARPQEGYETSAVRRTGDAAAASPTWLALTFSNVAASSMTALRDGGRGGVRGRCYFFGVLPRVETLLYQIAAVYGLKPTWFQPSWLRREVSECSDSENSGSAHRRESAGPLDFSLYGVLLGHAAPYRAANRICRA